MTFLARKHSILSLRCDRGGDIGCLLFVVSIHKSEINSFLCEVVEDEEERLKIIIEFVIIMDT